MSVFNPNFISFSGEPITGRMPTKTVVYGPEMTGPQQAGVAHAYKLFCDAVNTSVGKYVVQNRVLADGTKVRMISNWGNDTVMVWPAGAMGEVVFPPSGIGICFTHPDGTPVEGWAYRDADEVLHPQPLILRPVSKLNSQGEVAGSGKWRFEKVTKLVGGKRLWVSFKRKQWLSTMASLIYQQPQGNNFGVISLVNYQFAIPNTVNPEWTATSMGRVNASEDASGNVVADAGQYLFAGNDTVMLSTEYPLSPPFISQLLLAGDETPSNYVQLLDISAKNIVVWRGKLHVYKGLAEPTMPELPPPAPYLDLGPISIPITEPRLSLMPLTVSVHPDGKRAICLANLTSPPEYGHHIDITFSDTGDVSYAMGDLGIREPFSRNGEGGGEWTDETVYTPKPIKTKHTVRNGCYADGAAPPDETVIETFTFSPGEPATDSTQTQTATYSGKSHDGSRHLNRYYYDRAGKDIAETITYSTDVEVEGEYRRTKKVEVLPGVMKDGVVETPTTGTKTETITAYANKSLIHLEKAELDGRVLDLEHEVSSANQTLDALTVLSYVEGSGWTALTPPTSEYDITGEYSRTTRNIVHYDSVNDFLIYTEVNITGEFSSDGTNPHMTGAATGKIVALFKGVEVPWLAHPIELVTPDFFVERVVFDPRTVVANRGVPLSNGDETFEDVQVNETYTTLTVTPCPVNGSTYTVDEAEYTHTYPNAKGRGTTRIDDEIIFIQEAGAALNAMDSPIGYIQADYAVDPVTLSSVVHIVFAGANMPGTSNVNKTWTALVDATGVRPIGDVIKGATRIPDDIILRKDARINSLVSI